MIKRITLCLLCTYVFSVQMFPQGEINDEKKIFYRNESSLAFLLNSNGYGGDYRFARRINARNWRLMDVDFLYLKHPKEYKSASSDPYNYRSFVFGKLNSFFILRTDLGFQKEIYSKTDKGSISVRYFYNGGLSLGILKPIYYKVLSGPFLPDTARVVLAKFDPNTHTNVFGKAPFYKGLSEISLVPGVNVKAGLCFEFGQRDRIVRALEGGVSVDVFPSEIKIMATEKNNLVFVSVFASYRFGRAKEGKLDSRRSKLDRFLLKQNKNL